MTKAELDVFKLGRGIPNCVLEARPLCEPFPQLLHEITLSGIKPPHHELILSYMPSKRSGKVTSYLHCCIKWVIHHGFNETHIPEDINYEHIEA